MRHSLFFIIFSLSVFLNGQASFIPGNISDARAVGTRWFQGFKGCFQERTNRNILLGTVAGAGITLLADENIASYFETSTIMPDDLAVLGNFTGSYPAPSIVYGSILVSNVLNGKSFNDIYREMEMVTGAYATNTFLVYSLKLIAGRTRPDESNTRSFPSGHAANSFLMASLMHQMYGLQIGLPLYGLAAIIAASRLQHEKHYLSDIIMGAGIGFVIGRSFVSVYDRKTQKLVVMPVIQTRNSNIISGIRFSLEF